MANKKITYGIGFQVDKQGLKQVQDELQKIAKMTDDGLRLHGATQGFNEIKKSASELSGILDKAFNQKLGTYNLNILDKELKKLGKDRLGDIQQKLNKVKGLGDVAFTNFAKDVLTTNNELAKSSKLISDLGKTLGNTIKWSISSSLVNAFTGSIQKAWSYAQKLDESLNNIRIVTGKSAEDMEKFAKQANKAAKELGSSTTSYTNASLIYYQQGLSEKDVQARTKTTIKAANVTGQSAAEVSEQLTAVWNGYKVVAEDAEKYVDKLAAVAATTAADLEELSTGMSKVASAANAMGVDVDQLSAQLATIVSVTRQDASVVGTALKTIYSRMGDLKVDGVDEFGTSLGDVSGQLKQMGIEVLDQEGNLRDMGTVIEEVAAKWGTWTEAQQQAAAVAIAGKRQYNNLIALFENWDMYESALTTSKTSEGTLQKQQETYMESLEYSLNKLSVAGEKFFDALIDSESTKKLINFLAELVDILGGVVEGFGGAGNILLLFGSYLTKIFNAQIVDSIGKFGHNVKTIFGTVTGKNTTVAKDLAEQFKSLADNNEAIEKMADIRKEELKLSRYLTEEEKKRYELFIEETAALETRKQKLAAEGNDITQKALLFGVDLAAGDNFNEAIEYTELEGNRLIKQGQEKLNRRNKDGSFRKATKKEAMSFAKKAQSMSIEGSQLYEDIDIIIKDIESGEKNATAAINTIIKKIEEAQVEVKDLAKEWDHHEKEVKENGAAIEGLNGKTKAFLEENKKGKWANVAADIVSVGMAAWSTFNSISALGESFREGEATVESVIGSILSMLASAAPAIISSVQAIQSGVTVALGWIGLILAAVSVIMGLLNALGVFERKASAFEKASENLEKASEGVSEATKAYNEATQAVEDFETALSNLDLNKAKLDSLIPGTVEYKETIAALNDEVFKLIEQYPHLIDAMTFKDGYFQIDQDALKDLNSELQGAALLAKTQIISSQVALEEAKIDLEMAKFGDKKSLKSYYKNSLNDKDAKKDIGTIKENGVKSASIKNLSEEELAILSKAGVYTKGDEASVSDLESLSTEALTELSKSLPDLNGTLGKTIKNIQEGRLAVESNTARIDKLNETYVEMLAAEKGIDTDAGQAIVKQAMKGKVTAANQSQKNSYAESLGAYGLSTNYVGKDRQIDVSNKTAKKDAEYTLKAEDGTQYHVQEAINKGNETEIKLVQNLVTKLAAQAGLTVDRNFSTGSFGDKNRIEMPELWDLPNTIKVGGEEMSIRELFNKAADAKNNSVNAMAMEQIASAANAAQAAGYGETGAAFVYNETGEDAYKAVEGLVTKQEAEKIKTGGSVDYTWKDKDGKEQNGTIQIGEKGQAFYEAYKQDLLTVSGLDDEFFNKMYASSSTDGFTKSDWEAFGKAYKNRPDVFTNDVLNSASALSNVIGLVNNGEGVREKYLSNLGVSAEFGKKWDSDAGKFLTLQGYEGIDIRDLSLKKYKQELDYLKAISNEMENAFGATRIQHIREMVAEQQNLLTNDTDLLKSYLGGTVLDINRFVTGGDLSTFDRNALLDYIAELAVDAPDSERLTEAQSILDAYDKYVESTDALIDQQVELYRAELEQIQTIRNLNKEIRNLNKSIQKNGNSLATWQQMNFSMDFAVAKENVDASKTIAQEDIAELSKLAGWANGGGVNNKYREGNTFHGDDWAQDYEKALEQANKSITDMQTAIQEMFDLWKVGIKEIQDSYDNVINKVKDINTVLKSGIELNSVLGTATYSTLESSYNIMVNNSAATANFLNDKVSSLLIAYQKAVNSGNKELIDETKSALMSATEEINTFATEQLSLIQERFSSLTTQKVNELLLGNNTLASLSLDWSLIQGEDSLFLDEVNEQYAISTLKNNFQKSIDETDSIYAQNKLMEKQAEIQERLNVLKEEQGKLTQYDLDRANAEYELTLKQIALEEAQQTASKMKLTRDAMGNYTYQYVQDQDAIATAEQELADAQNNLYNLDKDRKKELIDSFLSMWTEYEEKMSEAMATGNEELQQRVYDYYLGSNGMLNMLQSQMGVLKNGAEEVAGLFGDDIDFTSLIANFKTDGLSAIFTSAQTSLSTLESSITTLNSTMQSVASSFATSLTAGWENTYDDITTTLKEGILGSGDYSLEKLSSQLNGYISTLSSYTTDLKTYYNQYQNSIQTVTDLVKKQDLHFERVETTIKEVVTPDTSEDSSGGKTVNVTISGGGGGGSGIKTPTAIYAGPDTGGGGGRFSATAQATLDQGLMGLMGNKWK